MKDLAVLRGITLMILLLVSMYLVFSSVTDKMGDDDEDQNKENSDLTSLLEDFEVITPQSDSVTITSDIDSLAHSSGHLERCLEF